MYCSTVYQQMYSWEVFLEQRHVLNTQFRNNAGNGVGQARNWEWITVVVRPRKLCAFTTRRCHILWKFIHSYPWIRFVMLTTCIPHPLLATANWFLASVWNLSVDLFLKSHVHMRNNTYVGVHSKSKLLMTHLKSYHDFYSCVSLLNIWRQLGGDQTS